MVPRRSCSTVICARGGGQWRHRESWGGTASRAQANPKWCGETAQCQWFKVEMHLLGQWAGRGVYVL